MNSWKSDLNDIQQRMPYLLARILRPRLFFLPTWWPVRYGAWAYLQCIFVAPGLRNAPEDVRHYLLGHEYGHLYCRHTILHFVYWLAMIGMGAALIKPSMLLGAISLITLMSVTVLVCWSPLAKKRELEADAIAVELFGRQAVLRGSLWMAEKAGTTENTFRQVRLRRLGWQGSESGE